MTAMDDHYGYDAARFNSPRDFILPETEGVCLCRRNPGSEQEYTVAARLTSVRVFDQTVKKAIRAMWLRHFRLGRCFSAEDAEAVLCDCRRIVQWCAKKYGEKSNEAVRARMMTTWLEKTLQQAEPGSQWCILRDSDPGIRKDT